MCSKYDFVNDLNPTKEDWRIKVRVVRCWKVLSFNPKDFDDNVDMVLVDERGGRIHATAKGSLQVRKKIHEGDAYFIKKFGVGLDTEFDVIEKESSDSFYLIGDGLGVLCYSFSIKMLYIGRKAEIHVICCVDVIGLLSGIGEVREHVISGRNTKMVVVELDNLRGQKLECTLWESYIDEVQTFLAKNQSAQNVIILQLARIKGKIGIANTKYTTKILFDSNIPEIVELSGDLIESSQMLTQLSSPSSYSYENDFLKDTKRKFLTDIKNCMDATTCITYGTIKSIESKYNWWYRFSVQVRVVGNTNSASFVLFDRDCLSLLGGADLEHYPDELNVLKDRSMLFKVNVKMSNLSSYNEPKYHVAKVCISESIITSFLKTTMDPNDDSVFDSACDDNIMSVGSGKAVDVQSQTSESTDDADISLTLLTPSVKYGNVVEDKNNCSVDRPLKKIKLEKELSFVY
ncbi:uncharacterized protein LOC133298108 [Gastrolobium bilobum]|uniref:uncharacterized protein LOC133298108 n=1 Tax=Gastrolobium bilobum TaxID=150636 RepID=UPI002AB298CC|nr:uncharacterized protein LOC133298108 [Gastrolobium bilobum]